MNYKVLFLLVVFAFIGCKNAPMVSFSSEFFSQEDLEICKDHPCSTVDISYPLAQGESEVAQKINSEIKQFITEILFLGDDEQTPSKNIVEASKDFIFAYRDHQADIPEEIDTGGYQALIDLTSIYEGQNIISVQAESYLYTGGVHGNGYTNYLNFDTQTGELIDIESLVTNFDSFQDFVEEKFRIENKIPEEESINATGFWFDDDQFYVSNNIGFSSENLIIVYNTYEIAPYSAGTFILKLPMDEVQPFLNIDSI